MPILLRHADCISLVGTTKSDYLLQVVKSLFQICSNLLTTCVEYLTNITECDKCLNDIPYGKITPSISYFGADEKNISLTEKLSCNPPVM